MKNALLVIDLQNDYFPGGAYPLWNAEAVLGRVESAMARAQAQGLPVILVQHVADVSKGPSAFFNPGTPGVEIHPRILAAAPGAPVVVKTHADAFHRTTLAATLSALDVSGLLVCGMMTQNCVTHTVLSKAAESHDLTVLADACTTVTELLHRMALSALSTRVRIAESGEAMG